MALLAMEMYAVMGPLLTDSIIILWKGVEILDLVVLMRLVQRRPRLSWKQLNASSITATEVDGDAITNVRTTSLYKDMPYRWCSCGNGNRAGL